MRIKIHCVVRRRGWLASLFLIMEEFEEKFNDLIWQRYLETRQRLNKLEQHYFSVLIVLGILTITYAYLYFQHFKSFAF